jgi:hypothetical protein
LFGTDGSHNATHGSDCLTSAEREMDIVFGPLTQPSATSPQHDLSTTAAYNTSGDGDDDEEHSPSVPFGDNVNTSAPIPTTDAEHPVNTPDLLSHPALVHAPTGSISDSVKPSLDDEGASETAADIDNQPKEDVADMQDPTSQLSTNHEDDTNETKPVNSIVDETPEQPNADSSSEQQQQQQDNLVTETTTAQGLVDHLTSDSGFSPQPASTPQDQTQDIHSPTLETAQTNLNDDDNTQESATKGLVPEKDSLLANEEQTIDSGAHALDTIDNKPVILDAPLVELETKDQQQHDTKSDDGMTPEQETESLAIHETTVDPIAKPDDVKDAHSADDHKGTGDDDSKAPTPQDDDTFDSIPLANDSETVVDEVATEPVVATATVELEPVNQDSEPAAQIPEPTVVAAVVAEETAGQSSEPTVSVLESEHAAPVLESESTISAEAVPVTTATVTDHDDVPEEEEHLPVDVMPVKPDSIEEPVAGDNLIASGEMKDQLAVETPDNASPVVIVTEEDNKPIVTEVAIVDDGEVEGADVVSNNDQSVTEISSKEQAESHAIHDESALTTDDSKPLNDDAMVSSNEEHHDDNGTEVTSATEEDLTTVEDSDKVVAPSTSDRDSISTDNDESTATETTVDHPKSVPSSDEETEQVKTSTSSDKPKNKEGSPANKPTSPTRSPARKSPTGLKAPTKIGTTRKVPSTTTTGTTTKSNTTTTAPATTRLRRPGTTAASGNATTAGADKPVKKATGLKSSASPGRTPLPRVATLAKKPDSAAPTETKPTTGTTKKRSSVINRLTAPTTASANKRASDAASSTTPTTTKKAASANGSAHRVKTAPDTTSHTGARRNAIKPTADAPALRRTSPSSTAEKPTTTRRTSPPTSTALHGTTKTARSTASSSATSRVSSTTTAASDSTTGTAKRSPVRRISPPSSTHPSTATKVN